MIGEYDKMLTYFIITVSNNKNNVNNMSFMKHHQHKQHRNNNFSLNTVIRCKYLQVIPMFS